MSRVVIATKRVTKTVIDQKRSAFHAKNLLAHAKKRGQSLRDVAKLMGLSPSYLSELTNGKRNWNYELEYSFLAATAHTTPQEPKSER